MTNQQFLKKRHIGPGSDCENMVRPDIGLMGRKNKMTGVISIMEQNGVEPGMGNMAVDHQGQCGRDWSAEEVLHQAITEAWGGEGMNALKSILKENGWVAASTTHQ